MGRARRSESLVNLSRTFAVTVRRAALARHLYKIDPTDPAHVVVYVAHGLTPAQEARAEDAIEADLQALARRRRRADLEPVAELADDDAVEELTGTDGDEPDEVALDPVRLSVVR